MSMSILKQIALLAEDYVCETQEGNFIRDVIDIFIASEELKEQKPREVKNFSDIDDDDIPF